MVLMVFIGGYPVDGRHTHSSTGNATAMQSSTLISSNQCSSPAGLFVHRSAQLNSIISYNREERQFVKLSQEFMLYLLHWSQS